MVLVIKSAQFIKETQATFSKSNYFESSGAKVALLW